MSYTITDSATMLRRNLKRMLRYPSMTVTLVGMPVIFLLLFVYVFGGTLGAGISGASGGRAQYVNYVTPAIILMTISAAVQGTAISVAMDMTEGIVDRFHSMSIARVSVLTGHVLGSLIQTMFSITVVIGVALLVGFRPTASVGDWFATAGVLVMMTFALVWLSVALGLASKSVEQRRDAPDPASVPGQRIRPHRLDAHGAALARRVPAVHPAHRNPARPADGHPESATTPPSRSRGVSSSLSAGTCGRRSCSTANPHGDSTVQHHGTCRATSSVVVWRREGDRR